MLFTLFAKNIIETIVICALLRLGTAKNLGNQEEMIVQTRVVEVEKFSVRLSHYSRRMCAARGGGNVHKLWVGAGRFP